MKYALPKVLCCILIILTVGCKSNTKDYPRGLMPAPIGFDEEELIARRTKWIELSHTGAPGADWRKIEAANVQNNIQLRNAGKKLRQQSLSVQESFANGKLQGVWSERGSHNQAGSIIAADYDSINNNLYVISAGGSIWKNTGLVANSWSLVSDDYIFDNRLIKIINKSAGGTRLFSKVNGNLQYSDNDGASFTSCNIPFPVVWGGNSVLQMCIQKSNNNNMYLLAYIWDNVSFSPALALYRSTDEGANFNRIYLFNHSIANNVKIIIPYNSPAVYVFDGQSSAGNIKMMRVNGSTVTDENTVTKPETLNGDIQFAGSLIGGTMHLYFMNNNLRIFSSTNVGATWTFKGTLPQNSWSRLDVSNVDGLKVLTGGVEAMRSSNGGSSWTVVNGWGEYYGNITGKLHADIMNIVHFKKSGGIPFTIINNHGGVAISYDDIITTINLSINGLHSAQYYDVLTALDNINYIYGGTQDQGMHRNINALSPGLLDFAQFISGDFGYLTMADLYRTLYCEYPGGSLYIYDHPTGNYLTNWTMPGTQKPNYGWMLPIKNTSNPVSDTILMAGGNLTGGGGSYLCRIAKQSPSNNITATQYNFDFRANSNNAQSGITAIEVSQLQPERIYTATEDGTFFYSTNSGSSWNKSQTFSVGGGWYLYGSIILASEFTEDLIWYGGSGYGGSSMFKSTNGGQTFTPMNNGLPQTLVHEVIANLNESMLFAATDAGPYVYVVADDQWYPMIGAANPIQAYVSVEYISSTNTARFATYGRGIFDFAISEPVVYYFFGNGNWDDPTNWVNQSVPPAILTGNHQIFINPYGGGECVLNINQTINNGAKIVVAKNKKFKLTGDLKLN